MIRLPLLLLLAALIVSYSCEPSPQTPKVKESGVTIGFMAPLSGPFSFQGKQALDGLQQFFAASQEGAVNVPVKIIALDTGDTQKKVAKALEELASNDDVLVVVTFNNSDALIAANKKADTLGIPVLAAVATHPDIAKESAYMHQFIFDDAFQGKVSALFIRDELLVSRVAIVSSEGQKHSQYLANRFDEMFVDVGGTITLHIQLSNDFSSKDVSSVVAELKESRPELVYLPLKHTVVAEILEGVYAAQWSPKILVSDGVLDNLLGTISKNSKVYNGLLSADVFSVDMPLPESKALPEYSRQRGSQPLSAFKVLGVESGMFIERALTNCQKTEITRACIKDSFRSTSNFQGLMGLISMGMDGKAHRPLVISRYDRGKVEFLVRVY